MILRLTVIAILVLAGSASADAQDLEGTTAEFPETLKTINHYGVKMRDGVELATDIYLPDAFAIDIESCLQRGGRLRVIASIETPAVIDRILEHLGREAGAVDPAHPSRAPPRPDRLI